MGMAVRTLSCAGGKRTAVHHGSCNRQIEALMLARTWERSAGSMSRSSGSGRSWHPWHSRRLRRRPGDAVRVNLSLSAAPPTSKGTSMPAPRRSPAVTTICWVLFTSRPESPMASAGARGRLDEHVGRYLDAEVDHRIAVVARMIRPDSCRCRGRRLDGREHHFSARARLRPFHELFQIIDGGLHGFRRLQHLGHDQLVVLKRRPTSLMPAISGPLMISSGAAPSPAYAPGRR